LPYGKASIDDYRGQHLSVIRRFDRQPDGHADLVGNSITAQIGVVQASSYRGATTTAGTLKLNSDFAPDVADRDVCSSMTFSTPAIPLVGLIAQLQQDWRRR